MDISSRALAFYQYQTSQELSYKTIMYQSLESKYTTLQDQLRDTIRDSNRVIKGINLYTYIIIQVLFFKKNSD